MAAAGRRPRRRRRDDRRLEAPARAGPRRDLQRPALQLPDPRAGDARRRLGAAAGPPGRAGGGARAAAHARLRVLERQAREPRSASSPRARWSRRSTGSWRRSTSRTSVMLTDPRVLQHPLAGAAARAHAADRPVPGGAVSRRVLITGGGGQLASDLEAQPAGRRGGSRAVPRRARHHRRRAPSTARLRRVRPDGRLQLRGVPQRRGLRARGGPGVRGQRAGGEATSRAPRPARARAPLHQLRLRRQRRAEPYDEERPAEPAQHLRDLQARRRARRAGLRAGCARRAHRGPLRPARQRLEGRQLRARG